MLIPVIFSSMNISENLKRIGRNIWEKSFLNLQDFVKFAAQQRTVTNVSPRKINLFCQQFRKHSSKPDLESKFEQERAENDEKREEKKTSKCQKHN